MNHLKYYIGIFSIGLLVAGCGDDDLVEEAAALSSGDPITVPSDLITGSNGEVSPSPSPLPETGPQCELHGKNEKSQGCREDQNHGRH